MRLFLLLPLSLALLTAQSGSAVVRLQAAPRAEEAVWVERHAKINAAAAKENVEVVLLGDSITQGWDYQQPVWTAHFPRLKAVNAGISSDRVEHVLWRADHGTFDKARPKVVILLAGINNLAVATPEQIAGGLADVIATIRRKSPDSRILLMGLFPSGHAADNKRRPRVEAVNALVQKLADGDRVRYLDIGPKLLEKDGTLAKTTAFDYLHLTRKGYGIWADALTPVLALMLSAAR